MLLSCVTDDLAVIAGIINYCMLSHLSSPTTLLRFTVITMPWPNPSYHNNDNISTTVVSKYVLDSIPADYQKNPPLH